MVRPAPAMLFLGLAVLACLMPAQSDTWWLLRTGHDMWSSHHFALNDAFSHTVPGRYWPNHEWLSEILFYRAYSTGGLPLLTALCATAVVIAWAVIYRITPGTETDRVMLVAGGAALSTASWSLRPQVFTLALFAIVLAILVRRQGLLLVPVVFVIWANLHGGVAAGGALVCAALAAGAIVHRRLDRRMLLVAVLALLATAFTPLGVSLWSEVPKSLQRLSTYGVLEWRAPSPLNPSDAPFWLASITTLVLVARRRSALREWEPAMLALATAATTLLALRSARNSALFMLCAVPTVARFMVPGRETVRGWSTSGEERPVKTGGRVALWSVAVAALTSGAFVAYAWAAPLERLQWHPVTDRTRSAMDACHGPLYNRYDDGGYLVWFFPDHPVFIDNRQDPYPQSLVLEQLRVEETGDYRETFGRYGIACALTSARSTLAKRLHLDGWQAHDAGRAWVLYTRPESRS